MLERYFKFSENDTTLQREIYGGVTTFMTMAYIIFVQPVVLATAAMDSASGGAVLVALDRPQRIVTLDLRIDYLRAATPHEAVVCRASCYKAGYHVAFTRAVAYHDDPAAPIATASGTFVIFRTPPPTAAGGPDGSEGAAT